MRKLTYLSNVGYVYVNETRYFHNNTENLPNENDIVLKFVCIKGNKMLRVVYSFVIIFIPDISRKCFKTKISFFVKQFCFLDFFVSKSVFSRNFSSEVCMLLLLCSFVSMINREIKIQPHLQLFSRFNATIVPKQKNFIH